MPPPPPDVQTPGLRLAWLHMLHGGWAAGLVAAAWMMGTAALLGLPVDGALVGLAFCGTALVYLADRALGTSPEDALNRPSLARWRTQARRWIRVEAGLLAVGAVGCALLVPPSVVGAGLAIGALGAAYVAPMGVRRLKAWDALPVGLTKPLFVAAVWAVGGVALPVLAAGAAWTLEAAGLAAARGLFVAANVLLADHADRAGDRAAGLPTVATQRPDATVRALTSGCLVVAAGLALGLGALRGPGWLWAVDAIGPALLLAWTWARRLPSTRQHVLALDLLVAWPAVTAALAWAMR